MKKFLAAAVLIFFGAFIACSDSSDDDQKIRDRITSLQTAITTGGSSGFVAYMTCFDDSDSYQASYKLADYNSDYPSGTAWSFGSVTIRSSTATCNSTTLVNGIPGAHANTFLMVKTGNDWYILKWTEDSNIIFQTRQPLDPQ